MRLYMTSLLCYLVPLFLIAVALDLYFLAALNRFRELKNEYIEKEGSLRISKWELWRQAFWGNTSNGMTSSTETGLLRLQNRLIHSRLTRFALEWLLIILIALVY